MKFILPLIIIQNYSANNTKSTKSPIVLLWTYLFDTRIKVFLRPPV